MNKVLSFKKPEKEVNFKVFGQNVAKGNLDEASRVLREILDCDLDKAKDITKNFQLKFQESPDVMMKTMAIKGLIEQGQQNSALVVIQDVFGVSGVDSMLILEAMKGQFK